VPGAPTGLLPLLLLAIWPWLCQGSRFAFFEPVQPPRPFQVMVHRGEANQAPENTRPALERCIEDGLEWAEVDLRLTQDGQHILAHDRSVTDAAGRSWQISDHPLDTLRQLDVGSRFAARFAGARLLSLQDCFVICSNRLNLYLDCKAVDPEQLAREVLAAGMERQVVVYASLEQLRKARAASAGKVATMAKWRPGMALPDFATTNGLAAVEIDAPDLTAPVAAAFHRAGIKVQAKVLDAWDTPEFWDRVIAAGADWLQTDLPEELLAHALWRRLPARPVRFSLHRGAGRYAPENTLPAFAKAIRMGADFVEFDVHTTRDGAFFLMHDGELDRTTDGTGPLAQATAEAVRQLSAGVKFGRPYAAVRVPSLDEFLAAVAGKVDLYFDAKAIAPVALAAALERHKVVERTIVYGGPGFLAQLKAINPRIRLLPPLRKPEGLDALATQLQPYAVDANWDILSRDLIARCHAKGVRVFSDALGKHERIEDYRRAMEWGIDLIQTDHPLRLLRAIELSTATPP
jgi:glycerophosphoryl diester phosphodiesterase